MAIGEDSQGRIWLGGVNGLFRQHEGAFARITSKEELLD